MRAGASPLEEADPDRLLEVNIAAEPQKAGLEPARVADALGRIRETGLSVAGLMCMPPWGLPLEQTRGYFVALRELGEDLVGQGLLESGHELSMGMSDDYEAAIEEGATLVRVGTAVFGARET